jgi:hypothetical protein
VRAPELSEYRRRVPLLPVAGFFIVDALVDIADPEADRR